MGKNPRGQRGPPHVSRVSGGGNTRRSADPLSIQGRAKQQDDKTYQIERRECSVRERSLGLGQEERNGENIGAEKGQKLFNGVALDWVGSKNTVTKEGLGKTRGCRSKRGGTARDKKDGRPTVGRYSRIALCFGHLRGRTVGGGRREGSGKFDYEEG